MAVDTEVCVQGKERVGWVNKAAVKVDIESGNWTMEEIGKIPREAAAYFCFVVPSQENGELRKCKGRRKKAGKKRELQDVAERDTPKC